MASGAEKKFYAVSMRLPETDIAIIDRAANLRDRSRTDFVREAALRAAEEIVIDSALIRMSPKGFSAFRSAIAMPAAAVPEMSALLKRKSPWETGRKKG
jgi:uncharacterized protein (DUF1778 family)